MNSRVPLSDKLPAALCLLALGAFLLGPIPAIATLIDVDVILKPNKVAGNPDGSGVGTWNDEKQTLSLSSFSFKKTGYNGSPDNLKDLIDLAADEFILKWAAGSVAFEITGVSQGAGIGGSYSGNGWWGTWKLSQRVVSVPAPGTVTLLGIALLALGFAQRATRIRRRFPL
jgi:hypothetical protein